LLGREKIIIKMKSIKNIKEVKSLKGKRVLLRLDLNVPIKNNKIIDDFRIKKILPTIKFLKSKKAKVVIVSHIGRSGNESLKLIAKYIKSDFFPETIGKEVEAFVSNMKDGDVVLLENLRKNIGEKKNDKKFAESLANLGDIYVNDAFSVSHREHVSIVSLPKLLPSYCGLLMKEEIKNLYISKNPLRPFLFILAGAKFKTKLPLIEKYLKIADNVFVGGALANNFFKAKGIDIGKSLVEEDGIDLKKIMRSKKLILPVDVVVEKNKKILIGSPSIIGSSGEVVDDGPETVKELQNIISKAKLVLFNGPLGNYEKGYDKSTIDLLKVITKSRARSIVGGGDTAYIINKLKIENKFTFVSTGGGAMIEFLAKGTLVGIEALKR
jgi:phosphoglycerate kinase